MQCKSNVDPPIEAEKEKKEFMNRARGTCNVQSMLCKSIKIIYLNPNIDYSHLNQITFFNFPCWISQQVVQVCTRPKTTQTEASIGNLMIIWKNVLPSSVSCLQFWACVFAKLNYLKFYKIKNISFVRSHRSLKWMVDHYIH